jgi:flagellar biogenesis protein FliO
MMSSMDWNGLLNPGTLSMLIPIIVLIGWILARVMKHRERMAMIDKGMNPDEKPR